ncbi:phage tail protein [Yersinia sp. 2545 StPb PI]|uniref:phage tail protein n=1 Tax=Yersinia sp. 2545 StPb PI TaxID=3117410 RepID=UPI003FA468EC
MQKIGDIPNTRADSNGEFTDGNVAGGVPPTILPAEWFNTIQRELMSILTAAEIEADSDTFNQVLLSIQKLIGEGIPDLKDASLTQKGIVQLSNATNSTSETLAATPKAVRAVDVASLKIANNLSEINTAGPAAVAATLANLGLGDVVHLPQLTGVVGISRNAKMSVTAASATATFTADEIIVQTELGGLQYKLANFNKTINLATTGAGGMNTGTAPVNGFVALYAIYNPTTQVSALFAVNATSAVVPEICGVTMPAGYTASALLTVVSTDASSRFNVVMVQGRHVSIQYTAMYGTTSNVASSPTSVSGVIPRNAISVSGSITMSSTTAGPISADISGPSAIGNQRIANYMNATESNTSNFSQIPIATPSTVTLAVSSSTTTFSCYFYASGYSI